MKSGFKETCKGVGGEYSKRNNVSLCSISENSFQRLVNQLKERGISITDSSLTSGGKMNIENIEKVERLINYNYYVLLQELD